MKDYGVFLWRGDGKYKAKDCVKWYSYQGNAERYAAIMMHNARVCETGAAGVQYVVRARLYIAFSDSEDGLLRRA